MNAVKIVIGIVFVVMATVVYGDADDKGCYVYLFGDPGWQTFAPANCKPWAGCEQNQRCDGNIGRYAVMSCNNASASTINRCADYPAVKCVDKGTLTCLTYTAWTGNNCTGMSGQKYVLAYKCETDWSGG